MRKTILAIAALALLSAAQPAYAVYGDRGEFEFGPYAGFGWLDDYDTVGPDDEFFFGIRAGIFLSDHWSVEASYQKMATETDPDPALTPPTVDVDLKALRANVLYNFRAGKSFRPFLTVGVGSEKVDVEDAFDSSEIGYNAGGGLRWYLTDHFGVRLDGRWVSAEVGKPVDGRQNNIEAMIGVLWSLGGGPPADADNDGVPDRADKCPNTPVGAKVDATGCPVDSDGDGVYDGLDDCANTPKGWPVDAKGCPKDTDGDGVPDGNDSCPDTPKGATVDAKGCPSDSDGDGVLDGLDRCPDTPKGATVESRGCPLDEDHDGVYDGLDKCPGTKHGAKVDADGCEIVEKAAPLFAMDKKTLVLEGVNFETNKADITPDSAAILEKVAASLRDWPEVKVEIGGHTDSTGAAAHNKDLSQRRANSVKAYLEAKGIDPSRMTAKGYGEDKPIADNKTTEGKARNRRVELTRID